MKLIFHITQKQIWEETVKAQTPYRDPSLDTEGFIHCSRANQVTGSANKHFKGQQGLVLLVIDEAKVTSRVVYEDLSQIGQAFPHIYGTLDIEAVVAVLPFPATQLGVFVMPALPTHLT